MCIFPLFIIIEHRELMASGLISSLTRYLSHVKTRHLSVFENNWNEYFSPVSASRNRKCLYFLIWYSESFHLFSNKSFKSQGLLHSCAVL